jgi:predicted TIM-barrel fold metal-dependent hydrolase
MEYAADHFPSPLPVSTEVMEKWLCRNASRLLGLSD